jgi:hypothetical protein
MVGFDQINFRKRGAAHHVVIEGLHVGQGVPVGNGIRIEVAVVAAGAPGAVLFGHPVKGRRPR